MANHNLPRLFFRGSISWDPGLANNSPELFDADRVELVLPTGVAIDRMKEHIIDKIEDYGIWNYYGTHDATFQDVTITGTGSEAQEEIRSDDPVVGRPVSLKGKLVDLDAVAVHCSQIFLGEVGAGDAALGFLGTSQVRSHGTWINFFRNLALVPIAGIAAVSWQVALPKAALAIFGRSQSPALDRLAAGMDQPDVAGLLLRFHAYRTLYFQNGIESMAELKAAYQSGRNISNPAHSVVVGWIGAWYAGESTLMRSVRVLTPEQPAVTAVRLSQDGTPVERPARLGPAAFDVNEAVTFLTLDLGATVPEQNEGLEKANLGDLEITVEHGGASTLLGTVPASQYDRAAYERSAGLISLRLVDQSEATRAAVNEGLLVVRIQLPAGPAVVLKEQRFLCVADERNVYLNEQETRTIPVRVFDRGRSADDGTNVIVASFGRDGQFAGSSPPLQTQGGVVMLSLRAQAPGFQSYAFFPFASGSAAPAIPPRLDYMTASYVNARTLPFDNAIEGAVRDDQLTWTFIYHNILRVYDVLNPVMSRLSNPSIGAPLDDEQSMRSLAQTVKTLIDLDQFERGRHMPVTRDMSAGRRRLLARWCDLVLAGNAPDLTRLRARAMAAADFRRA